MVQLRNLRHLRKGIKELTPLQQMNVTISSAVGAMVGLSIALAAMIYALYIHWDWRTFGFSILVLFILPMQWVQYTNAKKQKAIIQEQDKGKDKLNELMED